MTLKITALLDIVFKKVFGSAEHPRITLSLVNALLEQLKLDPATSIEVQNPFMFAEFEGNKEIVVDIKAKDSHLREYQIELQVQDHQGLPERMLYGFCRLVAAQLGKGQDYHLIKPTLAIWFINHPFLDEGWIEAFRLKGDQVSVRLCPESMVVVIDLPAWRKARGFAQELNQPLCWDILKTRLDIWLGVLCASEQLDPEALPEALGPKEYKEAVEVMNLFTKKGRARDLYEARQDGRRVYNALMRGARMEGLAEGKLEGKLEDARRLLDLGVDMDVIVQATGLSREQIAAFNQAD